MLPFRLHFTRSHSLRKSGENTGGGIPDGIMRILVFQLFLMAYSFWGVGILPSGGSGFEPEPGSGSGSLSFILPSFIGALGSSLGLAWARDTRMSWASQVRQGVRVHTGGGLSD